MRTERSARPEAEVMERIRDIERQIRLLHTLRDEAALEADACCQMARIAASQSDMRAMKACRG